MKLEELINMNEMNLARSIEKNGFWLKYDDGRVERFPADGPEWEITIKTKEKKAFLQKRVDGKISEEREIPSTCLARNVEIDYWNCWWQVGWFITP